MYVFALLWGLELAKTQVQKKRTSFSWKKPCPPSIFLLDRTLFFHLNSGEAILKRHPAMRRQNCFRFRLFLYIWGTFPWTFGGLSPVLLAWCGLGPTVFCHFLIWFFSFSRVCPSNPNPPSPKSKASWFYKWGAIVLQPYFAFSAPDPPSGMENRNPKSAKTPWDVTTSVWI